MDVRAESPAHLHEAKHARATSSTSDLQSGSLEAVGSSAFEPHSKYVKLASEPQAMENPEVGSLRPRTEVETYLLHLIGGETSKEKETQYLESKAEIEAQYSEWRSEEIQPDAQVEHIDAKDPGQLNAKQKKKLARFADKIEREAGAVLHTIELNSIAPVPEEVLWKGDPELLCCYNWQETQEGSNTILVPGAPPRWTPQSIPYALDKDVGWSYTDYNYARSPKDPYSSMFHALDVMNPGYQFMDVDVIADRNNLRVLLEFTQGKNNGPFRLNLYTVHKTLIITRRESKYWMNMGGNPSQASYGCNFEKAFTTTGDAMQDTTSHYRAIRYGMGSLNVVVRFEADAYYDGASDEPTQTEARAAVGRLPRERPHFDYRAPFQVLEKGHVVPSAQIAELKTTAYHPEKGAQLVQCQDQLWFGRTRHLLTGKYSRETGEIVRLKYEDARPRISLWEEKNQESLRKLVALLSSLKDLIPQQRGAIRGVVLAREDKEGPLIVRTMQEKHQAVQRQFFQKHWNPKPSEHNLQRGEYRGGEKRLESRPREWTWR